MTDVRKLIDQSRISPLQYGVIAMCVLLNMLDGMDVLVISFAAPVLGKEWGIMPEALGIVFSSALLGMAIGAGFIAPWGDRIGRRKMVILCLGIIGSGILLTAAAQSILQLIVLRFISGAGIGAMLATTATVAAEFSPDRRRNLMVSIVMSGYPIGATLSGLVAA